MKKIFSNYSCVLVLVLLLLSACKTNKNTTQTPTKNTTPKLSQKLSLQNTSTFINGVKEKILGNYTKAIVCFKSCLELDPHNAAALYQLASVYAMQSNNAEAIPLAQKAITEDPNNVWYQILLVDLYQKTKKYNDAISICADMVKKHPNNIEYYFDWALAELLASQYTEAIKVYDMVEGKIGITEDISFQKEKIYTYLNKPTKAIAEVQKLVNENPTEVRYIGYLAQLYLDNKMPDEAFAAYNKIISIEPNNANVHLSLAEYYRQKKDKKKFFEEIKLAFSNVNLDIDTKMKILLSYFDITNSEENAEMKTEAFELTDILIQVHPKEAKPYAMKGDFLIRDKKHIEAKEQFLKAVALDSSRYPIWEQMLFIDSEQNDFLNLAKESSTTIELFPEQPLPYLFNGSANVQLKNYDQAIKALNSGIKMVVENKKLLGEFYSYLGDACYKAMDTTASDNAYDKAIEIDPGNKNVLNNYSYYLSLRKVNLTKAETMSKKLCELEKNNASYLDTYGWVLYQLGNYEDAKIKIGSALENGGSKNAIILEHYGDVMYKLGDVEKAYEYWQKAISVGKGTDLLQKKIRDKKLYEQEENK